MKSKNSVGTMLALATAFILTVGTSPANADILSYMPFDGGAIGQSLADTNASGAGAIGFTPTFTAFTNAGNSNYSAGLSGTLGGSGNALQAGPGNHRSRMIIDRTTPAWVASGIVNGAGLVGENNSTLFGSVLIANPSGAPSGFTGLEFANGDPNSSRVLTVGEAAGAGLDWVVIGNGGGSATASSTNLALPTPSAAAREIVFRIDYGAMDADTFTLINPDGTDGVMSATSDMTFATLHLARFSGAPTVTYDEIRFGTTLADVTSAVPEPASAAFFGLAGLALTLRRRR